MIRDTAKISISNIAWPVAADDEALVFVRDLGFRGLELAPGKVFSNRDAVDEARTYKSRAADRGLEIVAFQALLFGNLDVALFGTEEQRRALRAHLAAIARLAGAAGAKTCVFGSPKARRRDDLEESRAFASAITFFRELASAFESESVVLAIEANAAHYGCDFLTHTDHVVKLVAAVDRPGIRLQLDTGTLLLNDESVDAIDRAAPWAAHFHASEPDLVPLTSPKHRQFGSRLAATSYDGWRSVEMRAREDWPDAIRGAASVMEASY